jgi:NADH dehydrogenase/putative oxidoreductase
MNGMSRSAILQASRSNPAHLAAVTVRWASEVSRIAERTVGPLLDLFIRLWLAGIFWASGMVKLQSWTTALYLSAHEYPVSWLDPVTAAWLGETIEIVCPPLLVFGLATRFAALPMLILSLVIQFSYQALDQHLFWAILFAWFVVKGAGPISLDALIGRGIAATALPLAGTITRIFEALSRWGDPAIKLLLRCWVAALFFRSGVMKISNFDMTQMLFHAQSAEWLLPPELAARLTIIIELACLIFLVLGTGTRIMAIILIGLSALVDPTYRQSIDLAYYLMVLGLIALHGPGALSIDNLVVLALGRRFPSLRGMRTVSYEGMPRVVIIGGGFGGIAVARALRHASCQVTLIDRRNYFLFQPLLYQVATAGLSPADIAGPIRALFRDQPSVRVILGEVTDVDAAMREVILRDARVAYDYLVVATGARHSYFGHDEWAPFAPGLKQIDDATSIRSRLLFAFEQAETAGSTEMQREMLTFVIVGGGPTGVELAGAIAELARHGLSREFRAIDPSMARVILMQSGPRILPAFPESLSREAAAALTGLGIEVLTGSAVQRIDDGGVVASGRRLSAGNVFWAAGVMASPAAQWLKAEADQAGRVKVAEDLSVPGLPEVFAIGDTALSNGWDGKPVPGLAPAAKQQGRYVASVVKARIGGRPPPTPFRYRHAGSLATIGRKAAVADFGWLRLSGALAWWVWGVVHILFLSGMRNRVVVALEWFWAYLTYHPSTRLITGEVPIPTRSIVVPATVSFRREG